jgi:hypothetical protein
MKYLYYLLWMGLLLTSCTKEGSDIFTPDPTNPFNDSTWATALNSSYSVNALPDLLAKPVYTDSLNYTGQNADTIRFHDSLRIVLPPSGFSIDATPKLVIRLGFAKTKGDIVANGKHTTRFGSLLETTGEFNISFWQGGAEVKPIQGKIIKVLYRNMQTVQNARVYYDTTVAAGSYYRTWVDAGDFSVVEVNTGTNTYILNTKMNRWVAASYLTDTANITRTKIFVNLPLNFTNKNTAVYAIFKDRNTVVRLTDDYANKLFYWNLPVGKTVRLVSLSSIGTDLYYAEKDVAITNNLSVQLVPQLRTKAQVTSLLDAL